MRSIGLVSHLDKAPALQMAEKTAVDLAESGYQILIEAKTAEKICSSGGIYPLSRLGEKVDMVIAFGGDGTLLKTARKLAPFRRPLLGVNMGNLGFLTELEVPEYREGLEQVLAGNYFIEKRMMLSASVMREREEIGDFVALNDVVVTKGAFSRLVEIRLFVEEEYVDCYLADGLIVASPTGSTAYSLSAGGPIVSPELDLLLITPICPHSFYTRSIVVPPKKTLRLQVGGTADEILLTADGQKGVSLQEGDEIRICASQKKARFVRLKHRSFYENLRIRLKERDQ